MTRKDETPQEQENSVFKVISTIGIFASILLTIYFTFFLWHIFTPNDGQTFTYSKSDLGTLGDLIGGILNPVLSFVTIGLLLWSIRIQGKELSAATEQSRQSAIALKQTSKIHKDSLAQAEREELYQNTKEKFATLIEQFKKTYSARICSYTFEYENGQKSQKQLSLRSIPLLSKEHKEEYFPLLTKQDLLNTHRQLRRLNYLSKSISLYAKTYFDYGVNPIYYSDDFFQFHEDYNLLYGNLGKEVGEKTSNDASKLIHENELLSWKIITHKAQTQTKPD